MSVEQSRFLNAEVVQGVNAQFGTPAYVYDRRTLIAQAEKALQFPNLYGLKVRFAMKACPNAAILQLFNGLGICFDASSGFEVLRLVRAGISPSSISLSSQELPSNLKELIELGIEFNACSLHQLRSFGKLFPGGKCGVRFNPGKGSGGTGKTVSSLHCNVSCYQLTFVLLLGESECWWTRCVLWCLARTHPRGEGCGR